ncbi:MAG: BACON domain-containing carbohydrate-binding protein [Bacteroidetes bacterium]|nr:BACON domain-containing carbohydrate-binding protein [Bacteroidota bacterium]
MKKLSFVFFFLSFILLASYQARSQQYPDPALGDTAHYPYWISMMQDPNAPFHATQSAFEKYWAGRSDYKGNGWKVFKRWEYIHQDMVQQNGKLPDPASELQEYNRYMQSHSMISPGGNWSVVGPVSLPANSTNQPNGLGRINCVGFDPVSANTIYTGSPSGGFWKSTDAGATWTVLITNLPTLGVSSILVHPTNTNQILIGTGDRDAGDAPGMGVYKSTDGGTTWSVSNSGMGNLTVGMMIRHPSDPNMILAATAGGIYKSTDGGATWARKSANTNNYKDIKFKPGDPTIVYATENGKFYRSTNTGDSWTQITSGVITGNRLVIGVSPNQPATVYLLMTNGVFAGLLRSTDSGLNFTTQSTTPNIMDYACDGSGTSSQAWYDLCIAVDPNNANTLYTGGVNIWKSTNSGVSWTINTHWVGSSWGSSCAPSVHADIHSLDWSPVNGNLYTGCDGGIYATSNGGTTWSDISSGLSISQIYKIGQSATKQGLVIHGYQDNGTATSRDSYFWTVIGGDGMECIIDYSDTNYRYGELYYGSIRRTTGTGYLMIKNNITETGPWVTPYILHVTDPNTMFAGFQNVWRTTNVKAAGTPSITWTAISTGETSSCSVLEQSPADPNVLYVSRGTVLKRTDNSMATPPTWVTCTSPSASSITDMAAHPTDANTIYATAGTKVYKSIDKGITWTNISGTLPGSTINSIVYDKNTNEGLYIGNKTAVFYKDASMPDWISFSTGLPVVDVRELDIYYNAANPANNRLKAATYGRGLWQTDLMGFLTVTPSNQNVPASPAGNTAFSVSCNAGWSASTPATWCSVTPTGTGNGTLTATYQENMTVNQRIATITLTSGSQAPQSVTVTQAGAAPILIVTPLNQNVPASPTGSTSFTVTSNTNWNVTVDSSWCSVTSAGSGNGSIIAGYTENLSVNPRVATLTVTVSGLPPVQVTVTQAGAAPILIVTPPNQNVTAPAGSASFNVTSNTNWTVTVDATWCTVTPSGAGNGIIIADYTENLSVNPRVATLTVTVSSLTPVLVTVTQDGAAPILIVTPPYQNVNEAAGSTQFNVTSNTTWTAVSGETWCTVTNGGNGNGTILADYTQNTTYVPRIAMITVTVSTLTPQVVAVDQAASTVAVGNHSGKSIRIYPNPTPGSFSIDPRGLNQDIISVTISDITGRTILISECKGDRVCGFDLSGSPEGCYIIRIRTGEEVIISRVMVDR